MEDLLKALQIFTKYIPDERNPTWCEHDVLHVNCSPDDVSEEDLVLLEELSFSPDLEFDDFRSFRFGSC